MAAGLDMVAAKVAAAKAALIPMFELLSFIGGFPSIEHLTLPLFPIDGKARIVEDGTPTAGLCTRAALVTDEVGVLAVKVAIIFNVQRKLVGKSAVKLTLALNHHDCKLLLHLLHRPAGQTDKAKRKKKQQQRTQLVTEIHRNQE